MKKNRRILTVLFVICTCLGARNIDPSRFQFRVSIKASNDICTAVRVHLPASILSLTNIDRSDIRLFDENGSEIPFVIYARRLPSSFAFLWKVIDFQTLPGKQILILEKPDRSGKVDNLLIKTPARNFRREVIVYIHSEGGNWIELSRDLIFDYSAQVDLRKTNVSIPQTEAQQLKLELLDSMNDAGRSENVSLKYKDLSFVASGTRPEPMRVEAISSNSIADVSTASIDEELHVVSPTTIQDRIGDSVIALNHVNLPIHGISVKVRNAYFYRTVAVLNANQDDNNAYRNTAQGDIYRIPGMAKAICTLNFDILLLPWIKLRIVNKDNPPLDLEEIILHWRIHDLYFIPEKKGNYTLFFGNKDVSFPMYESVMLVPDRPEQLQTYPEWSVGKLEKNPDYKPLDRNNSKQKFERILLVAMVLLLFILLSIWIFRLIKKIPIPPQH